MYYYNWNYPQDGSETWVKKIPGPFHTGIIDTALNVAYMYFPLSYGKEPEMNVNYYVNDYSKNKDAYVKTPFCESSNNLPIITLEIN